MVKSSYCTCSVGVTLSVLTFLPPPQGLQVLYQLWHQSTVDVFFIDWEKPRGLLQTTNQNADAAQTTPPNMMSPVSIWRTYFVVNEWNELQSLRRVNNTLLVVMVLLFAHVIGLEHLAERDPASNVTSDPSRYSAPFSPILRFSITAIFFSLFAALLVSHIQCTCTIPYNHNYDSAEGL